jgi:hypothetical protein
VIEVIAPQLKLIQITRDFAKLIPGSWPGETQTNIAAKIIEAMDALEKSLR